MLTLIGGSIIVTLIGLLAGVFDHDKPWNREDWTDHSPWRRRR